MLFGDLSLTQMMPRHARSMPNGRPVGGTGQWKCGQESHGSALPPPAEDGHELPRQDGKARPKDDLVLPKPTIRLIAPEAVDCRDRSPSSKPNGMIKLFKVDKRQSSEECRRVRSGELAFFGAGLTHVTERVCMRMSSMCPSRGPRAFIATLSLAECTTPHKSAAVSVQSSDALCSAGPRAEPVSRARCVKHRAPLALQLADCVSREPP